MELNSEEVESLFQYIGGGTLGTLSIYAYTSMCVPDIYSPVFGGLSILLLAAGYSDWCPFSIDRDENGEEA